MRGAVRGNDAPDVRIVILVSEKWDNLSFYKSRTWVDRTRPMFVNIRREWNRVVSDWHSIMAEWNMVMNWTTLAYSKFENPSNEDLELADSLNVQSDAAWARMKEFQSKPANRPG